MANAQVREVLEYLLLHDDDGTFKPLKDGVGPFLCHRITQMCDEGQIDREQALLTRGWIEWRIHPDATLSGYHIHHQHTHQEIVGVTSDGWPEIRRKYLRQWILELTPD